MKNDKKRNHEEENEELEKTADIKFSDIVEYWRKGGIYLSLLIVIFILSFFSKNFFTTLNLVELVNFTVVIAIIALGQTFVIGGKGIDLSVGSVFALSACIMAWLHVDFAINSYLVILIGLMTGAFLGFIHGTIIAKVGIPDLIVTLGGMEIWRGVVYLLFEERVLRDFGPIIRFGGRYRIGSFPVSIIILLIFIVITTFVIRFTPLGYYILAIGGNKRAAIYSGINYDKFKILSYVLSGFFCGLAAWIMLGRLNAVQSSIGLRYELMTIAAVVIGGTSLFGGVASMGTTVAGALLISVVRNGMLLGGFNYYWYLIILGILMILAVALPSLARKKAEV